MIKKLTLVFPRGISVKSADDIAHQAGEVSGHGVSEGGFSILYMPIHGDDPNPPEFSNDEMTYVYNNAGKDRTK